MRAGQDGLVAVVTTCPPLWWPSLIPRLPFNGPRAEPALPAEPTYPLRPGKGGGVLTAGTWVIPAQGAHVLPGSWSRGVRHPSTSTRAWLGGGATVGKFTATLTLQPSWAHSGMRGLLPQEGSGSRQPQGSGLRAAGGWWVAVGAKASGPLPGRLGQAGATGNHNNYKINLFSAWRENK